MCSKKMCLKKKKKKHQYTNIHEFSRKKRPQENFSKINQATRSRDIPPR